MNIKTEVINFETQGNSQMYDLTQEVQLIVKESGFTEGQATVFGIGSTTGITTVEFEPGLVKTDVREMFEQFAPYEKNYAHNQTWGDDNGAAHLRSFLVGTSFQVPFVESILILGTWQQIVFVDFDTRPRKRKVVVQLIGG